MSYNILLHNVGIQDVAKDTAIFFFGGTYYRLIPMYNNN